MSNPPPAGIRFPSVTTEQFPSASDLGPIQFSEPDGAAIYVCSVLLGSAAKGDQSVCPGKCGPNLRPACRYPYAGNEKTHEGRYDILPITDRMEWVPSRNGEIPKSRRPVEGGYEVNGEYLYHAAVTVEPGIIVPGKTGVHLGAATCAYGNKEVVAKENYVILCWK